MKIFHALVLTVFLVSCAAFNTKGTQDNNSSGSYRSKPDAAAEIVPSGNTKSSSTTEKKIKPLAPTEIENRIIETVPSSFDPVRGTNGHIDIFFHDLDRNGYQDAFFLVIKKQKGIKADIKSLSDISRLAEKPMIPIDFFLSVYLQIDGKMISMYRIPIGSRYILNGFKPVFIKKGKSYPFGLNISFLTEKGTEEEWILFSSYNRFSFFNTVNDTSTSYEFTDINGDGIKDIVEWRHGLEEGTGYETYLTWYQWNGREFKEKASTNIVRNLNLFLSGAAKEILNGNWKTFFKTRLDDKSVNKTSGLSSGDIFNRIFIPDDQPENSGCINFRSVIFPKILENPFSKGENEINLMVRFQCAGGESIIRSVRIAMNSNPFDKKQFFFILK